MAMITPTAPRRVKGRTQSAPWYAHAMSTPGQISVAGNASPTAAPAPRLRRLLEKYELLVRLTQSPPGRTTRRRDDMRAIAERFPAALREWDQQPPAEIERRRQLVATALSRSAAPAGSDVPDKDHALGDCSDPEPAEDWLRYGLDLHDCLRAVLQLRRAVDRAAKLAGRRRSPPALATAALSAQGDEAELLAACARLVHDCGVPWLTVTPALLAAIREPAQGRLAAIAYDAVAQHHRISAAAIKAALFGPGDSGACGELRELASAAHAAVVGGDAAPEG